MVKVYILKGRHINPRVHFVADKEAAEITHAGHIVGDEASQAVILNVSLHYFAPAERELHHVVEFARKLRPQHLTLSNSKLLPINIMKIVSLALVSFRLEIERPKPIGIEADNHGDGRPKLTYYAWNL